MGFFHTRLLSNSQIVTVTGMSIVICTTTTFLTQILFFENHRKENCTVYARIVPWELTFAFYISCIVSVHQ